MDLTLLLENAEILPGNAVPGEVARAKYTGFSYQSKGLVGVAGSHADFLHYLGKSDDMPR